MFSRHSSACRQQIFPLLHLILGVAFHILVAALLIERLRFKQVQNEELVRYIETMEWEHKEECTKFNEYMNKIQRYFPHVEKLLPLIDFCRNTLKFSERLIQELCKLKKVRLKGDFYSPEFNRKFRDESAAFSFEEDKNRKGHYHIRVNDIPLANGSDRKRMSGEMV